MSLTREHQGCCRTFQAGWDEMVKPAARVPRSNNWRTYPRCRGAENSLGPWPRRLTGVEVRTVARQSLPS